MKARGQEFSQLAYQILVVERSYSLQQVARDIGLGYDALHARINGRTVFSADEIAKLIGIVQDPRLVAYILRHSKFVGVVRVDGPLDDPEQEIMRATHRILLEAADVLEAVDDAFKDKRLNHREARIIQKEIETTERALITLREHVRHYL
ncbi:phage regulatory CII family protein [Rhizobium leguminosarum]